MIIYKCDVCGETIENAEEFNPQCLVGEFVYDICAECLEELNNSTTLWASKKVKAMIRRNSKENKNDND